MRKGGFRGPTILQNTVGPEPEPVLEPEKDLALVQARWELCDDLFKCGEVTKYDDDASVLKLSQKTISLVTIHRWHRDWYLNIST